MSRKCLARASQGWFGGLLIAALLLGGCRSGLGTTTAVASPTATATTPLPATPTPPPTMPADFAFHYSVDWCGDVIEVDTFNGTYTAAIQGGTERDTVSFAPTASELRAFYDAIVLLDFFSLPGTLPYLTGNGLWGHYALEVRADGWDSRNRWSAYSWTPTPTVLELRVRRFTSTFDSLVRGRPELRELRRRGVSCT